MRDDEAAALETAVVPFSAAVKELRRIERELGRAEGRDAERQRIRQAITSHPQLGEWVDVSDALAAIADLLDGGTDAG